MKIEKNYLEFQPITITVETSHEAIELAKLVGKGTGPASGAVYSALITELERIFGDKDLEDM